MTDIAIRVEGVSKSYHIYDNPRDRLKQSLWLGRKQFYREFKAVDDVSFEVKKGESVGIIGRNGSGKSTLLQIICGTLAPTTGTVKVHGRIGALLELGSGFNPEFTGKENVYMNGAILGLSKKEIDARYEEIIAFSEIGEFINQPVNTYSSGMMVRLAFAVQVAVEPDILIVDEALSVGDFFFQQKCFSRIKELRRSGMTLLFVSHDMGTVRDLCSRALSLNCGKGMFFSDAKEAIRCYLADASENTSAMQPIIDGVVEQVGVKDDYLEAPLELEKLNAIWVAKNTNKESYGFLAVEFLDKDGCNCTSMIMSGTLIVRVYFNTPLNEFCHITLIVKNKYDQTIFSSGSSQLALGLINTDGMSYGVLEMEMECNIEAGEYSLMLSLNKILGEKQGTSIDSTGWFGPLKIDWDYVQARAPFLGMFGIPLKNRIVLGNLSNTKELT